jgi:hypothetical protein
VHVRVHLLQQRNLFCAVAQLIYDIGPRFRIDCEARSVKPALVDPGALVEGTCKYVLTVTNQYVTWFLAWCRTRHS